MDMNDDDVHQLVTEIWGAVLGLDVAPSAPPEVAQTGRRTLTGFVHIGGDWQGTVTLECPAGLATTAAATMFGMEEDELGKEEVDDALGELTNMTGGGIKSLLPGSCTLSLPTVVEGVDYSVKVPGTEQVRFLTYACDGHPVVIRLLERAA
jgi:CheY-specific phosphatase CheX